MDSIRAEYIARTEEIKLIIDLLKGLNDEHGKSFLIGSEMLEEMAQNSILHILYSATLVMIYNLAESTAISAVEHIYDHLKDSQVSYDDLSNSFKERVFKDFRKKNISSMEFIKNFPQDAISSLIISESLDRETFFSGNVDARKIRNVFKDLSFSYETAQQGANLERVKEARKKLTHSESTFARYGRSFSLEELQEINMDVVNYFDDFLVHLEQYIDEQRYLA